MGISQWKKSGYLNYVTCTHYIRKTEKQIKNLQEKLVMLKLNRGKSLEDMRGYRRAWKLRKKRELEEKIKNAKHTT